MKWAKPKRNKNKQRNIGMEQPEFPKQHIISYIYNHSSDI